MNLTGKKVVITGANGALGKVVAEKVASLDGIPIRVDLTFDNKNIKENVFEIDLNDQSATDPLPVT